MPRSKDSSAQSPRTREQYERTLERAFGKRVTPDYVPNYKDWPETTRSILRAALKSYWQEKDKPEVGVALAAKIKAAPRVKRHKVWPTADEGERFEAAAEKLEDRGAFLITKLCLRFGLRSEEMLQTPRAKWHAAQRWGRLTVIGKGNKERVIASAKLAKTIEELLAISARLPWSKHEAKKYGGTPPAWTVPGEILAKPGSTLGTQRNLLDRFLKRAAVAAGLDPQPWHPHNLRHVFADRYIEKGGNVRALQDLLGHESLETTAGYTHPTVESAAKHLDGE